MSVLKRDELYTKVWQEPMTKLALRYNLSDVGLKKICIAMGIPTPKAGHWAKLRAGKKVKQTPLPPLDPQKNVSEYTISNDIKSAKVPDALIQEITDTLKPIGVIEVPEKIRTLHPLVEKTKLALNDRDKDMYGAIRNHLGDLHLRVSDGQLKRALRIYDTVCKTFDRLHLKVQNEQEKLGTYIILHGEEIHFLIEERFRQVNRIPTKEEKEYYKKHQYWSSRPYDYQPTGELSIRIDEYCDGCRKKWRDGGKKRVEEQLGEFFRGIFIAAAYLKKRTLEREEESRKYREEQFKRELEKRKLDEEKRRYQELEQLADNFSKSQKIREYVLYVKNEIARKTAIEEELQKFSDWENWALEYVMRLEKLPEIGS